MVRSSTHIDPKILAILETVKDPEIPVISIVDLGVVQHVEQDGAYIYIEITPTYTGCPAMDTIRQDIILAFAERGLRAKVHLVLSPPWTTDMISKRGREALQDYGIAAPLEEGADKAALIDGYEGVPCPQCGSTRTEVISAFGSTACKALFRCLQCKEPFDYFKCHR